MKKLAAVLLTLIAFICLTGCTKTVTKINHETIKTYQMNGKVVVKTFGSNTENTSKYNALDNKISNYLGRIKNINDYRIKVVTGAYSDHSSYGVPLSTHGAYGYVNYRYATVILIKKR